MKHDDRNKLYMKLKHALKDAGFLTSLEHQPPVRPGHGPCCTCQECGRGHDECVCESNNLLGVISGAFTS